MCLIERESDEEEAEDTASIVVVVVVVPSRSAVGQHRSKRAATAVAARASIDALLSKGSSTFVVQFLRF